MKLKLMVLLLFLSIFILLQVETTNGLEKNEISFQNLSSNHFLEFVKDKQIENRISKICTIDFCDYTRGSTIENSFSLFISKYEKFLTEKENSEVARSTILKGFPIIKINVLD